MPKKRMKKRHRLPAVKPGCRSRFSISEKENAWKQIESNQVSVTATAEQTFGVARRTVQKWRTQIEKNKQNLSLAEYEDRKDSYTFHPGAKPTWADVNTALLEFFIQEREKGTPVTKALMVTKYKQLDPDGTSNVSERALGERMKRWMFRNRITYRCSTHVGQNTRFTTEIISHWVSYVLEQIRMLGIPPENVVNVDETNANFSVASPRTYDFCGEKTISVTAVNSSNRATVMLGVSMAGEFLAPFTIFAGKDNAWTGLVLRELQNAVANGFPEESIYAVQEKAWMNEKKMLEWVDTVWKPFTLSKEGITYLIMDEFGAHKTEKVLAAIRACGTEIEFIPRGYTSKLQVMDVGLNRPFKDKYRAQHNEFLANNPTGTKVKRQDVARWIVNAWGSIHPSAIANTWRHVLDLNGAPQLNTRHELVHEEDDDLFLDSSVENQSFLRQEFAYDPTEGPGEGIVDDDSSSESATEASSAFEGDSGSGHDGFDYAPDDEDLHAVSESASDEW